MNTTCNTSTAIEMSSYGAASPVIDKGAFTIFQNNVNITVPDIPSKYHTLPHRFSRGTAQNISSYCNHNIKYHKFPIEADIKI